MDASPHPLARSAGSPSPRILVVDDEESVLRALQLMFQRTDYQLVACTNPLQAIAALKREEFGLVISDQRMPGLSGLELLAEARRLQPLATRILMTGVLNLDVVMDAINKGEIYRFLTKPWLQDEFLIAVRNGLQRYELIRQNADLQTATRGMNERLAELNHTLEARMRFVTEQNSRLTEQNAALAAAAGRSLEFSRHILRTFHPPLAEQVRRVAQLAQAMAETLKLSPNERRTLETSAQLYDIGLVGVPRHIIQRWQEAPASLSTAERELIARHPAAGQELAALGKELEPVGQIIRAHHERYDGTGYPDQLAGEEIPWLARVLSTCVTFVSAGMTFTDSVEYVKSQAHSALDPDAVRVFLETLPKNRPARTVRPEDLRPGMILAENIYSRTGFIIAPQGETLSKSAIDRFFDQKDHRQISEALLVYC